MGLRKKREISKTTPLRFWQIVLYFCGWNSRSVLTDGVSGPGGFTGNSERAESKSVLSTNPEQVVLTFQQTWHDVGLASTGCIHLITHQPIHQLINHQQQNLFNMGLILIIVAILTVAQANMIIAVYIITVYIPHSTKAMFTFVQALSVTHFFSIK